MIIIQTPLRISFFGGGTDLPEFYKQEGGCVLSTAIDKYIFVIVKERFDQLIRVGYTQTELVEHINNLKHELVREALRTTGIRSQIEVGTMGDIPSSGTGLGSSSTVTVGTLNALYNFINNPVTQDQLAREACQIEIDVLKKPIGKQDQYIAAYGGLRFIRFLPDESVSTEYVYLNKSERRRFNQQLMLFYTNKTRRSDTILNEQSANIKDKRVVMNDMKQMVFEAKKLLEGGDFDTFGRLLGESWKLKKTLASNISDSEIDGIYDAAISAGALGGKITGAGGGGFLLLYCPREQQYRVRSALETLQELPFHLEKNGSKVVFNYRR
jgi:D-glycero-alpha-D-manno-heptose-7-phosphate kinase